MSSGNDLGETVPGNEVRDGGVFSLAPREKINVFCHLVKGFLQNLQLVSWLHEALHQLMTEHILCPSECMFCTGSVTPEQRILGSGCEARGDTSVADTATSVCFPGEQHLFVQATGAQLGSSSWAMPLGMSLGQERSQACSSPLSQATAPVSTAPALD